LILALVACWSLSATAKEEKKQAKKDGAQKKKKRFDPMADDGAPKVGNDAPLFTLKTLNGERAVDLSKFKGKKPVCLIFGSYT